MQPRLTRSRSEVIIAGVCGGLAEYFNIDPVIVRLIFVLVTLTSGFGILVYPILWLVMPKAGAPPGDQHVLPQDAEEWRRRAAALGQEAAQVGQQFGREMREVLLREQPQQSASRVAGPRYEDPPPHTYNFDPLTGEPIRPTPATGQTMNLRVDPALTQIESAPDPASATAAAPRRAPRRYWRIIGFVLVGIGGLVLAEQIGIDLDIVFPLMMIVAGYLLLRRR